jgi:hypothetical protein
MRNYLSIGKNQSLYLFMRWVIKTIAVMSLGQLHTKFYLTSCCQTYLHIEKKALRIISVDFNVTGQILIIYISFVLSWRKRGIQ